MTTRCFLLTKDNAPVGDLVGNHVPRKGEYLVIEGNNAALVMANHGSTKFEVMEVVYPVVTGPMNAQQVRIYVTPVSWAPGDLPT